MSEVTPEAPLTLASLQQVGADRLDPMRWQQLQALARRLPSQPEPVRQLLHARLQEGLQALAQRVQTQSAHIGVDTNLALPSKAASESPLRSLTTYLESLRTQDAPSGLEVDAVDPAQMKSVRRFSEAWSKIAVQQQLDRAIGRAPEQAGPLNSHRLMLRSLTLMRDLSPDYLRRFLAQMETLLWLDQVNQSLTLTDAKAGKKPRPVKAKASVTDKRG